MIICDVNTPSKQYPIYIQSDLMRHLNDHLRLPEKTKVAIVTNETIAPLYLNQVQAALDALKIEHFAIILPDGESHKNAATLNLIYDGLLTHHCERNTPLIALGGGVIGDMTGFAAATYQRGAPFIQIPTTLLSQVDSSVGGKTAINHPLGKNMIGAFHQPEAVFIDPNTLHTLPQRELSAGLAEVIKYALLGNVAFLQWLETHMTRLLQLQPDAIAHAIQVSCEMKAAIVAADETERGQRALLNLGHTFGHAIETELGYGTWLHGEAVAAGMVMACQLSEALGFLQAADTARVVALLKQAQLPTRAPKMNLDTWLKHMSHDKKVSSGQLRFIALRQLGDAFICDTADNTMLQNVIDQHQ